MENPEQPLTKKQRRELKKQEEQTEQQQSQLDARSHRRLIGAGVIAALVIVVFGLLKLSPGASDGTVRGVSEIPDPFKGGESASVVIELYEDFQCPACGFFQPTVKELMAKYGDQIKVVYNDFPLSIHRYGRVAAIAAAAAAAQGKFWEYHDLLYENQEDWTTQSSARVKEIFRSYAAELGLDLSAFDTAQDDESITASIDQDVQEASSRRISATPTVIINGSVYNGVRSVESLSQKIDSQIR
ncbi:MAG: thioredoxin domain-containing protein [Patescibacteria group bacterium]